MPKKKFKDTKVGQFILKKIPGFVGDILPEKGVLGVVKNLIDNEPSISPEQKKELKDELIEFYKLEVADRDSARKREGWSFKSWGKRVNFFLKHVEKTFNPDLIIIGGGVSKKMNKFKDYITIKTPLKAAELKNNAGIIGAAIFAKKQLYSKS